MAKLNKMPTRMQQTKSRQAQVASDSWREGKTSAQRGYGWKWQVYRRQYLSEHRYCRMCLQQYGLMDYVSNEEVEVRLSPYQLAASLANVVDHIQSHRGDMGLFWDESNHQPLCKRHHDSEKQKQDRQS